MTESEKRRRLLQGNRPAPETGPPPEKPGLTRVGASLESGAIPHLEASPSVENNPESVEKTGVRLASPVEKTPVWASNLAPIEASPHMEASRRDGASPQIGDSLTRYQRYEKRRRATEKEQLNIRISKGLKARLGMVAIAKHSAVADLVEAILESGLASIEASLLAPLDLIDRDKIPVIEEYVKYTSREWTAKDDLEYAKIAALPLTIRTVGLYNAFLRTKASEIRTFKYVATVIRNEQAEDYPDIDSYISEAKQLVRRKYGH